MTVAAFLLSALRASLAAGAALAAAASAVPAWAGCQPVAGLAPRIVPAGFQPAQAAGTGGVRITFLGHATFLIESPGGVAAVTDYTGVALDEPPDVATMNRGHSTHYTDFPDPKIPHVLRGWDPAGGVAAHDLEVGDMRVRNVPTDLRGMDAGNSIFVFEVGDLCLAHLGHLHHRLTDEHLGALGVIDVLFVPVDGGYTLAQELMVDVVDQIRPAVVVPMHAFGPGRLERFLDLLRGRRYAVRRMDGPTVEFTRATLPYGEALVLPER